MLLSEITMNENAIGKANTVKNVNVLSNNVKNVTL